MYIHILFGFFVFCLLLLLENFQFILTCITCFLLGNLLLSFILGCICILKRTEDKTVVTFLNLETTNCLLYQSSLALLV